MKFTRMLSLLTACALCACALCASLSACQPEDVQSVSCPAVSSELAAPTPAPTDTPAPSEAAPTPGVDKPGVTTPVLTPGTDFSWLFANANPIEDALRAEMELADSQTAIVEADLTAIERYKRLISIAYEDCLTVLSPEDQEALKAEQAQWEADTEAKIEELTSGEEDSSEWKRSSASEIYAIYWSRAHNLCKRKFDADGVMPSFEDAMEEPDPVG